MDPFVLVIAVVVAIGCYLVPLTTGRSGLWPAVLLVCIAQAGPRCASVPPPSGEPPVLLPWLAPATSRPLVLSFRHEVEYDPAGPRIDVAASDWRMQRMHLALFGGGLSMQGQGRIGGPDPSDVATTLTLERVDVQALLKFLQLPRADEVEARVGGRIYAHVRGGEWAELQIHLLTEPDSVRLSRGLIKQLLGGALDPQMIDARVEPTLKLHFGDARMIPIQSMRIDGKLGGAQLTLKIPIHNEALNIDFEPLIDRSLLWEAWGYLKDAGLRDIRSIEWGKP